jgi:hypothetical protein
MERESHRIQRLKKPNKIYSPSDPLQPNYYLVCYDFPEKYRIIGRSSIQKLTNGKAVIPNFEGEVQIVSSGKIELF